MSFDPWSALPRALRRRHLFCVLALVSFAALYIGMAPNTVQGMDAGELVAGAYNRTLVHAPGYPLWVWLTHVATHLLPFKTVFFRASFINIVWGVLVLTCLSSGARFRPQAWVTLIAPLALQHTFFYYVLIPDVFMLHGLLFTALCLTYERGSSGPKRTWLLAMLFALGMANHQTFIFAAPLVAQDMFAPGRKRLATTALMCSLVVCALLYASLMAMQPTAPQAFGHLQSTRDWLGHVLRQPYGTWQLSRTDARVMPWTHWGHFVRLCLSAMPVTFILGCVLPAFWAFSAAHRRLVPRRFWWLWGCMTIYMLVFFLQVNQSNARVTERFLLMPLIGYTYLAGIVFNRMRHAQGPRLRILMTAVALLVCIHHVASNAAARNLSGNTIAEDYAQNLLRMAEMHPPTILVVDGDTPLGALRYVQHVQHISDKVAVIASTGLTYWQLAQLRELSPNIVIPELRGRGLRTSDLMTRLIVPNEPTFSFLLNTTRGIDVSGQQVVYMGLGRRLQTGAGRGVDRASLKAIVLRSSPQDLRPAPEPDEDKVLFSGYAMADFVAGKFSHDAKEKRAHFQRALALVPYCWPAAFELCLLDAASDDARCRQISGAARTRDARYF